jgi:hypothetical protein
VGTLTSWNCLGHSRPVTGLLYLYLYLAIKSCTETKVTDVKCHPVGEENEIHIGHQEVQPSGKDDEGTKQLYYSAFKYTMMVMYLQLHCTVCNCHSGCTPVASFTVALRKFLHVLLCKDCETVYGDGEFACGDGSEPFCHWCGQGEKLPFYRAKNLSRPFVFPSTSEKRNVWDESTYCKVMRY